MKRQVSSFEHRQVLWPAGNPSKPSEAGIMNTVTFKGKSYQVDSGGFLLDFRQWDEDFATAMAPNVKNNSWPHRSAFGGYQLHSPDFQGQWKVSVSLPYL